MEQIPVTLVQQEWVKIKKTRNRTFFVNLDTELLMVCEFLKYPKTLFKIMNYKTIEFKIKLYNIYLYLTCLQKCTSLQNLSFRQ